MRACVLFLILYDFGFTQTQVQITHLYHSGFIVEFENTILIFDYYPAQNLKPKTLTNGYIETKYFDSKQVIVFISHEHQDHFFDNAINWKSAIPNIHYFVSKEVASANENYKESEYVTVVNHESIIEHKEFKIKTIRSADSGVAFLVQTPKLTLYHSGDHASWNWQNDPDANDQFIHALQSKLGNVKIDIAMHVYDQRLNQSGYGGFFHFINAFKPVVSVPMHAKGKYFANLSISEIAEEWGYYDFIWKVKSPGEVYRFSLQRK